MFFWVVFLKTHKKAVNCQKRNFYCFWWLITFLKWVFQNTDQNSMCVSIVVEAETKEKYEENICLKCFVSKLKNNFFGGHAIFLNNFLFCFSF